MNEIDITLVSTKPRSNQWYLQANTHVPWAHAKDLFTADELKKIINTGMNPNSASEMQASPISSGKLDPVRHSYNSWLYSDSIDTEWIFRRITDAVLSLNNQFWKFDLTVIEGLQFTRYQSPGQYYGPHCDTLFQSVGTMRKLSFSVQLTDPDQYQGGDLLFHYGAEPVQAPRDVGTILFFPSWMLHEVTPVTQGTRHSLVGWVHGPNFR